MLDRATALDSDQWMPRQDRTPQQSSRTPSTFLSWFIPLTLVGLTVADFARDGKIDKYLIGSLVVFGLASFGYRLDTLIEKFADRA